MVHVSLTVGLKGSAVDEFLRIHPDPAKDEFVIQHCGGAKELLILDASGRVVSQGALNGSPSRVNISHLAQGSYYLLFENERGRTVAVLHVH